MAVSVISRTGGGSEVEVSLEKTGRTEGTIRVRSWKAGADPQVTEAYKDETYILYDLVTDSSGTVTTCRANVPGTDPTVTITMSAIASSNRGSITIDVKGTSFRLGDGRTTYEISSQAQKSIQNFLIASYGNSV